MDGQNIYLVNDGKILYEGKVEGTIKDVNISKNGYMSVITEGSSYKSVIITFDKSGKELFKTYLASTIAVATDISVDGKYLAIAEIDIGGAVVKSSIKIIDIEKASNGDTTNSVIYKYSADSNKIIKDIKYQEKGQLICMYDDSIHMIYEDADSILFEFDNNTQIADINLKSYTVRTEETSTGLFSVSTDIILTNILTNTESTYTIESTVKDITNYEQIVAINLGTEVHLINLSGTLEKRYTSTQEIKDIVLGTSVAGIVYGNRIKVITF